MHVCSGGPRLLWRHAYERGRRDGDGRSEGRQRRGCLQDTLLSVQVCKVVDHILLFVKQKAAVGGSFVFAGVLAVSSPLFSALVDVLLVGVGREVVVESPRVDHAVGFIGVLYGLLCACKSVWLGCLYIDGCGCGHAREVPIRAACGGKEP